MTIAKVEPLLRTRAVRGPFDYLLPPQMGGVGVGAVLRVPFGRRAVLGVVIDTAERSELPAGRLAQPIEALETDTPAELVRLGLWLGSEYCSTPARGLALVLAPGTGASGQLVRSRSELCAALTAQGSAALSGGERLGSRQRAALQALGEGELSWPELRSRCGASRSTLRALEERGLVSTRERPLARVPAPPPNGDAAPPPIALNEAQRTAAARVESAVAGDAHESRELLLYGVTGSGKTEVYLAAAEAALRRGRGTIILVPEIALTPQATARFRARLGARVAVLHSAMAAGERYDEWRRIRRGEATVCVGPRSAVFAPVRDLGLIVIDEEHDASYKQEGDPSYDAREVAARRAAEAGAALVAGSATPRPESWQRLGRVELPSRVDARPMPAVEVIDMREQPARGGPLHAKTLHALEQIREGGEKAIVLINRRGFAPYLCCRACGHHWGCPHCDISLVVHRSQGFLACHHCGHTERVARHCPACGSLTLAQAGVGSEQVEELLAEHLDPWPVFRLDSDSASGRRHGEILARFASAGGGVLVGTQMVAKGHDFPEVTLSVVLDADATLRFPDFRAEERTFAMVAQLAGRSGRGSVPGRVIVQTLAPEAASILAASRHDAPGFLRGELERRRALRYPPFSHLVAIGLAGEDPGRLDRAAAAMRAELSAALDGETELLGPAPLFRLRGRHRRRFLLKSTARGETVAAVRGVVERLGGSAALRGMALSVDVNPQ